VISSEFLKEFNREKEDRDVGLPFFSQRKYCVFKKISTVNEKRIE